MYCVHVFAIVYVFVCTIIVCGCICLYVYVPPMRKSGYADHCEVKSSINQSINQSIDLVNRTLRFSKSFA